jgi:hypothetical protein
MGQFTSACGGIDKTFVSNQHCGHSAIRHKSLYSRTARRKREQGWGSFVSFPHRAGRGPHRLAFWMKRHGRGHCDHCRYDHRCGSVDHRSTDYDTIPNRYVITSARQRAISQWHSHHHPSKAVCLRAPCIWVDTCRAFLFYGSAFHYFAFHRHGCCVW